jgi:hypothetical protein
MIVQTDPLPQLANIPANPESLATARAHTDQTSAPSRYTSGHTSNREVLGCKTGEA